MYSNVSFAIIKPGLGTVEECLKRGIVIFPIIEMENKEFQYKSKYPHAGSGQRIQF